MLEISNIVKDYETGSQTVHALKGVSIAFRESELVRKIGFRYGKLCRESAAFLKSAANWRANRSSNRAMNTACSTSCCAARLDTITWNLFSSSGMAGLPNCLIHHGSDFIHRVVRCTV